MKKLFLLTLFFSIASAAFGKVSARAYRADGNTPLEPVNVDIPFKYQDIMVGTRLTIIIDSNVIEEWSGSLIIEDDDVNDGELFGRGSDLGYPNSCLEAAGVGAEVVDYEEPGIDGFDLYTGYMDIEANDWFIIDYNATDIGDCNVGFYKHNIPFENELLYYLEFSHVRSRDFDENTNVDSADFAILASYWQQTDCNDPNWCEGSDLDTDGTVDANDLRLFTDYWLESTR